MLRDNFAGALLLARAPVFCCARASAARHICARPCRAAVASCSGLVAGQPRFYSPRVKPYAHYRLLLLLSLLSAALTGCHGIADLGPLPVPSPPAPNPAAVPPGTTTPSLMMPNPLPVPIAERQFFWNQLVDTVDDYFDIRTEQSIHALGNTLTEGRIETAPLPGSTVLEPWRWDSTRGFERWHGTLQSIRRRARVRAIPQGNMAFVEVIVEKALEDVDLPSQGTPGSAIPRHDSSLMRLQEHDDRSSQTLGWIPIGRDHSLEQEILRELNGRLLQTQ